MPTNADAVLLVHLAAHLQRVPDDPPLTAERIVHSALEVVPEADHASLTVHRGKRHWTSLAATSALALAADQAQYHLEEGPCIEAAEHAEWFRSGDVSTDARWPRWGPQAADLGVGSLLSVRLLSDGSPVGALNLYADERGHFADRDVVDLAFLYATHAAVALVTAEHVHGLATALTSRHTIGLAQGILMERHGLTARQSFALLQRMSSTTNVKLREVASRVAEGRVGAPDDHEAPSSG